NRRTRAAYSGTEQAWELWPAAGSCNGRRNEGNLDPSREHWFGVGDTPADGPGDQVFLRCFVGGGGWRGAAAVDKLVGGTAGCNSAVLGRSGGKSKPLCRKHGRGKSADVKQVRSRPPSSPTDGTGQRPLLMAGENCLFVLPYEGERSGALVVAIGLGPPLPALR